MVTLNRAFDELMNCLKKMSKNEVAVKELEPLFRQHLEEFTVKDHRPLVTEGEIPKYFYFQIRGISHLKYYNQEGTMQVFRFYGEGKIILRKSYLLQEPSPCTIVAAKGSLMFRLSFKNLRLILNELPGTLELLMRTIMEYDVYKQRLREEMLSMDVIDRTAEFYLTYPMLLPASKARLDAQIAAYLFISKGCLSKTRKRLGLQ